MADKSLVMTFLNVEGSRTSITLNGVKDTLSEAEVSTAMDAVIVANIFNSTGGDLVGKHSAQVTERNITPVEVR